MVLQRGLKTRSFLLSVTTKNGLKSTNSNSSQNNSDEKKKLMTSGPDVQITKSLDYKRRTHTEDKRQQ